MLEIENYSNRNANEINRTYVILVFFFCSWTNLLPFFSDYKEDMRHILIIKYFYESEHF